MNNSIMAEFDLEENSVQELNYPFEEDTAFTPDEQEAIKAYKDNLTRKLSKNRSVLKGLEMSFWGISSYSIARFLILSVGVDGMSLAFATILVINQITNREIIEELINRRNEEGGHDYMGGLIKFGFSSVITAFLIWSALGNFFNVVRTSDQTYKDIQASVKKFNSLPEDDQNKVGTVLAIVGLAGLYITIDSRRIR